MIGYTGHTHTLIDFIFSYTLNTQGHKIYKEENVSKNKKKSSYISQTIPYHHHYLKPLTHHTTAYSMKMRNTFMHLHTW